MKRSGGTEGEKRRAGESAAELVSDGDVVGLGTGSTAAAAIRALGRRIDSGLDIRGIPTSYQSRKLAREVGIPIATLEESPPDIAIDGADQIGAIDAEGAVDDAGGGSNGGGTATGTGGVDLIKGGGAAHAREKLVDSAAERFVVVADRTKLADRLSCPVPIEVLPDAVPIVTSELSRLGGEATLRAAQRKDGPVVTDNGNLVLDCAFGPIDEPGALTTAISTLPGVVEHGLFVRLADEIHVGTDDGVDVYTFDAP